VGQHGDCRDAAERCGAGSRTADRFAPPPQDNKVKGRQKSLPPVDYVALGENDQYFVQVAGDEAVCGAG
jgi:hypothetical protein